MLIFLFLLSFFLIFIIYIRIPKETLGLTNSINSTQFSGSPAQLERNLDILITICVFGYLIIAFKLNIDN